MIINTALWRINDIPIVGPNEVLYAVTPDVGKRIDGVVIKQGDDLAPANGMTWRWQALPVEHLATIMQQWALDEGKVSVQYLGSSGAWSNAVYVMTPPTIGRRSGFMAYDIAVEFLRFYADNHTFVTQPGANPVLGA